MRRRRLSIQIQPSPFGALGSILRLENFPRCMLMNAGGVSVRPERTKALAVGRTPVLIPARSGDDVGLLALCKR